MSSLFLRALAGGVGRGTCGLVAYHASWILSPGRIHVLKIIITENKAESIFFTKNTTLLKIVLVYANIVLKLCFGNLIANTSNLTSNFCDPSSSQRLQGSWPYCGRFTRDDQNEKDDECMCMFCVNKGTTRCTTIKSRHSPEGTGCNL